ncbi:uncharacterized protein LOC134840354 [Symsagittifera roscoffensis]|uniref:uncharacterized protein LOC134840354 n=1 Tax=Symsagittifera roscoffensis TaxID=84072 RepID=UPI00307B8B30
MKQSEGIRFYPEKNLPRDENSAVKYTLLGLLVILISLVVSTLSSLITYQLALREFTAQQTLQNSTRREENTKTGTDSGPIFIAGSDDLAVRNLKEVQNITEFVHTLEHELEARVNASLLGNEMKIERYVESKIKDRVEQIGSNTASSQCNLTSEKVKALLDLQGLLESKVQLLRELNRTRVDSLFASKVLSSVAVNRINSYFEDRNIVPKQITLLYRGSQQGFSAKSFHAKCDNRGPTLVVVRSKADNDNPRGQVFGGYTTAEWQMQHANKIGSKDDFLFSLEWKEALSIQQTGNAIKTAEHMGPQFGVNPELKLGHECHKETSENSLSKLGSKSATFQTPSSGETSFVRGPTGYFVCDEYEVYSVRL